MQRNDYILIREIARQTPYSAEYLGLLVRKGKIDGQKFGRNWSISKSALAEYLVNHNVPNFTPVSSHSTPFKTVLANNVEALNPKPETLNNFQFSNSNISIQDKKEIDSQINSKLEILNSKQAPSSNFENLKPKFSFPNLQSLDSKIQAPSYKIHDVGYYSKIIITGALSIAFVLGGFNFKFADALYGAVKNFVNDAMTLQGKAPGTGANEVLLLDKKGNVSIQGNIETQGQLRSFAPQGVVPIVVDSQTTVPNLSADMLDGLTAGSFDLNLVTKNGAVTSNKVTLGAGAEVVGSLFVNGSSIFSDYVSLAKDLYVNGKATISNGLDIIGNSTLIGRFTLKGDLDATGFIAAQRAQIKEGGLTVQGNTQLNSLGVTGGASVSDLGVSGNFAVAGKQIDIGDSTSDKMTVTASSTFKGPFEVTSHEAKFGRGLTIQSSGLSVTGSTNITGSTSITGNTTITGDLTVSGAGSFGSLSLDQLGLSSTTPGAMLGVNGSGIFEGFVHADYFTSTSTNSSYIFGNFGIGTTTPGVAFDAKGTINSQTLTVASTIKASEITATSSLNYLGTATSTFSNAGLSVSGGGLTSSQGLTITGGDILSSGKLTLTTTATSTSNNGFNIAAGCFSINSTCIEDLIPPSVSGSDTQVQFNDSNTLGGNSLFTFTKASGNLTLGGDTYINGGDINLGSGTSTTTLSAYNGSFGIATTAPGAMLGVKGSGMFDGFISADYFTSTSTNNSYIFGNFGIGTSTPGTKLAVDGDASVQNFYAQATTTTSSLIATSTLEVRGTTGNDLVTWNGRVGMGSSTPSSTLTISNDSSNSTSNLIEAVNSVGSYNFVVTNGGSVGIGTYNPSGYLSVYGNTYLATTEGNVGIATTSPGNLLDINGSLGADSMYIQGTSTMSSLIATSTLEVRSSAYTGGSLFNTFKEKIGIGSSTPGSLLSVQGVANIGELTIEGQLKTSFITATSTTNNSFAGALDVTESATSTFTGGINVTTTGGLSSATGLTITGGDILSSGKLTLTGASTSTAPQLNVSTILTTPTLDVSTIIKNSGTATSTFAGGLITATGGLSTNALNVTADSLFTGKLTSASSATSTLPNLNASTIFSTPILNVSTIIKNSGTATSTFDGGLSLGTGGLNITSGGLYVDVGDVTFDQKLVVNGNVGIGTTTPNASLEVYGASNVFSIINSGNTSAGGAAWLRLASGDSTTWDIMKWTGTTGDGGNLWFSTDAGATPKVTFKSDGNVGIGTTSPETTMVIQGPFNTNNGLLKLQASDADAAGITMWASESAGATYRNWQIVPNFGAAGSLDIRSSSSSSGEPIGLVATFNSSGNLGVGTGTGVNDGVNGRLVVQQEDSATNSQTAVLGLAHSTTGTAAAGFGGVIQFGLEDDNGGMRGGGVMGSIWKSAANGGPQSNLIFEDNAGNRLVTMQYGGNVGIGTTAPTANLQVINSTAGAGPARFYSIGDNTSSWGLETLSGKFDASGTNQVWNIYDGNGDLQGQVTFSSGTVSYGAFTANHDVSVPEAFNASGYPYGTLMCIQSTSLKNGMQRGIEYNVDTCKQGDNKKVLGAYAGKYDNQPNLHQVYVLGDGHIRVNGEGGNISIGDAIMVSSTEGIGTKVTKSGITIGIAQEDITFATPDEVKLVPVQYGLRNIYADNQLYVDPLTGNVGIGSTTPMYKLAVDGDVAATSFVNISTKTAKKDISYLSDSEEQDVLTKISNMNVATYRYNSENSSNPARLGLIAEEAPSEVLSISGKGVDIYKLSSFILAGVKAQQVQIDNIKNEITNIKAQITNNSQLSNSNTLNPIPQTLVAIYTVAKTTLASISSAIGEWADSVLADDSKFEISNETETEFNFKSYSIQTSREEIQISGSATLANYISETGADISATKIKFDSSFSALISPNEELKIIVTPASNVNGIIYVNDRSIYGFEARNNSVADVGAKFDFIVIGKKRKAGEEIQSNSSAASEPAAPPSAPSEPSSPEATEDTPISPVVESAPETQEEVVVPVTESTTPTSSESTGEMGNETGTNETEEITPTTPEVPTEETAPIETPSEPIITP